MILHNNLKNKENIVQLINIKNSLKSLLISKAFLFRATFESQPMAISTIG